MEKATATVEPFEGPCGSIERRDSNSLPPNVAVGDEAVRFCQAQGLKPYLQQCLTLVGAHFRVTSPITVSVQSDPEFPDEWLEIDLTVVGDVDSVSAAYDAYTRDWLDAGVRLGVGRPSANEPPGDVLRRIRLSIGLT